MSAVGKLLVFLNLVFSLVVGTFAVMDYTARTHWKDGYEKVAQQLAIEKGTAAAYKADAERLSKEKAEFNAQARAAAGKDLEITRPEDVNRVAQLIGAQLTNYKRQIDELRGTQAALQKQLQDEKIKVTQYEVAATGSQKDVERRQIDVRKVEELLVAQTKETTRLAVERNKMRDDKVAAEIEATSLRDKNVQMAGRLAELERDLARVKLGGQAGGPRRPGTGAMAGSPPPENLEGRITQVAEKGLVRISIGSDNGLSLHNTLEVFRLGSTPKYLGKIRIVSLMPDTAVGQVEGKAYGPLLKDDMVATKILGGR